MTEHEEQVMVDDAGDTVVKLPTRRDLPASGPATTSQQRLLAMVAHLLGILTGPLGALIIWLVMKKDAFVEEEAREALNFQITVWLAIVAASILTIIGIGVYLISGVAALNIVFCVIAAAHVNQGEAYRYPVTLRLIKQPA
ncbi:MAG: DUF4870 domain-containing protein [Phycisphaerales bacterium]|nr:DUF4870 domain-containing protein [Phycisphaerales bacterium]